MTRRRRIPVGAIRRAAAALLLAATPARGAETSETSLPDAADLRPLPLFVDRRLGRDVRLSVDEARRRLSDSRCQEIFGDFSDGSGRRLDQNLAALGKTGPDYLPLVLFYDGRGTRPCARRSVLAWTTPGSRAVLICGPQFLELWQANPGYAANILIHETLHTLGLGENPPGNHEITARVAERCGR